MGYKVTIEGENILILPLLLPKDPSINLPLLKRRHLHLILAKINLLLPKLRRRPLVIRIEDRPLQQQPQPRRLRDAEFVRAVAFGDPVDVAAAADEQRRHGNHLADLVHHEALAVDLEREPFGVVDEARGGVDDEAFDDAFGGRVAVLFLYGVVVEVVRADVEGEGGAEAGEAGGVDAVGFFGGDVGCSEGFGGVFERGALFGGGRRVLRSFGIFGWCAVVVLLFGFRLRILRRTCALICSFWLVQGLLHERSRCAIQRI